HCYPRTALETVRSPSVGRPQDGGVSNQPNEEPAKDHTHQRLVIQAMGVNHEKITKELIRLKNSPTIRMQNLASNSK
ncbi:MAG: hypothetical protein ACREN8_07815, partial [Candidatus Dormibacteraceae bacterium]